MYIHYIHVHGYSDVHLSYCIDIEEDVDEATPTSVAQRLRSEVFKSASAVFSGYWVLLVVAAFLLVTLSGEPNLFKTIYLVFFFVFLITYQVSSGHK